MINAIDITTKKIQLYILSGEGPIYLNIKDILPR